MKNPKVFVFHFINFWLGCIAASLMAEKTNMGMTVFILEWTNLCVHQLLRLYLRVRPGVTVSRLYRHIRQERPFSNQYLVYEFPFCAMHMRVSSVSLP